MKPADDTRARDGGEELRGGRFWFSLIAYNIILHGAFAALWLSALFSREFRGRLLSRLGFRLPKLARCIWLHAPSVGEALAIRAFVAELRRVFPEYPVVLTTFTSGGRHVAKQVAADHHLALPYDLYPSVVATVRALKPALFLFVEGDYWPNLMYHLARQHVPTAAVNGRLSAAALKRYRRVRWLYGPLFRTLKYVCAAEEEYVPRYVAAGVPRRRITVTGNLKYDNYGKAPRADVITLISAALGRPAPEDVLIAASTHGGEEEMLAEEYLSLRRRRPALRFFVAPRYPARAAAVVAMLERKGIAAALRSQLPANEELDAVVLDTLGELGGLYPLGAVAVIGGSFVPRGGQNMMEAAYHRCVPIWGPYVENFPVETAYLAARGGVTVADARELGRALAELYADADGRERRRNEAAAAAREMMGASARTVEAIRLILKARAD